jgi:hypothetical protein
MKSARKLTIFWRNLVIPDSGQKNVKMAFKVTSQQQNRSFRSER